MLSLVLLSACASKAVPPGWTPKPWAGWPETSSVVRTQDGLSLSCSDQAFRDYVCLTYEDYITMLISRAR